MRGRKVTCGRLVSFRYCEITTIVVGSDGLTLAPRGAVVTVGYGDSRVISEGLRSYARERFGKQARSVVSRDDDGNQRHGTVPRRARGMFSVARSRFRSPTI